MDIRPQDILFFIAIVGLLYLRKPQWFAIVGLLFIVAAIPLFSFWVFFTAQRFMLYGVLLLLVSLGFNFFSLIKKDRDIPKKKKKS